MPSATKILPPDEAQKQLSDEINAKLSNEAKVKFYRTRDEDGATRYGTIFEYGSIRRSFVSHNAPYDADHIVKQINRWVGTLHESQRWSLTP